MIALVAAAVLGAAGPIPREALALQNAGVAAANRGDLEVALERLEEARRLAPDHETVGANLAEVLLALGARRREGGDLEEAVRLLDRAARIRPDDARIRALLGRTLYDLDEYAAAAEHLRRAVALEPDTRLAEALARAETDAEVVLGGLVFPHPRFRLVAPADLFAVAQGILPEIERALDAAERVAGRPARRPVSVLLYPAGSFPRSGAPDWAGGFYDGKVRLRVGEPLDPEALRRTAAHEFAHAILEQAAPGRFPIFLHEGIAILAAVEARDPFAPLVPSAAAGIARRAADEGRWIPIEDLEASFRLAADSAAAADGPDVALLYAEVEVLVRHLRDSYGPARLADVVASVSGGARPAEALENATLRPLGDLDEEVRRSL